MKSNTSDYCTAVTSTTTDETMTLPQRRYQFGTRSVPQLGPTPKERIRYSLSSEGNPDDNVRTTALQQQRRDNHNEGLVRPPRVRGETIIAHAGLGWAMAQQSERLIWAAEHNDYETVKRLILPRCRGKMLQRTRLALFGSGLVTAVLFAGLYYLDDTINQGDGGDGGDGVGGGAGFVFTALSLVAVLSMILTLFLCMANLTPWVGEPGLSPNFYTSGEYTSVLHVAAAFGADDVVSILLKIGGANPNVTDLRLRTPLHYAALHRHVKVCRMLVQSGAHVFVKDDKDLYPYDLVRESIWAETATAKEIVKIMSAPSLELLKAVKIGLKDDGSPDGVRNVLDKHQRNTQEEEDRGGMNRGSGGEGYDYYSINVRDMTISMSPSEGDEDDDGNNAWQNLNEAKQTQVPRGTWGMTPLMLICRDATCSFQFMEWEMIVRDLIVDHGCDVNFPHPKNGMTPLHYAVKSGNRALSILLLGLGADPARPRYTDGKTPLHIACARSGGVDVVSTMMKRLKGDDEDATSLDPYDIAGSTPLHEAMATARDISLVRELLSHGANPTLVGKTGRSKIGSECSPMGWLSYQGGQMHLKMMALIADSLEKNPLTAFNINARDPCGLSPLHLASRGGRDGMVRWMLDRWSRKIDVDARCSKNFKTPMEYAKANGHVSTLRLLKRFVATKDTNVEEEVGDQLGMRARRGTCNKGARAAASTCSVEQDEEKVVPKMKQI